MITFFNSVTISILIQHFLVFVLANDCFMWFIFLYKHMQWIEQHPDLFRRKQVTPRSMKLVCWLSFMLCTSLVIWWAYFNIKISHGCIPFSLIHQPATFFFTITALLAWIHYFAIFARFYCMPRRFWPPLSMLISRFAFKTFKTKPFPY